jgi:hypothetical protein
MNDDLEKDEHFQNLIKSFSSPPIDSIAQLAQKRNITNVTDFWEFFDYINRRWREGRSFEGNWE